MKRDGLTVKTDTFEINRGQEKVLEVTYTPPCRVVRPQAAAP